VIACADALAVAPGRLIEMRQALPGGGLPNWT